MPRSGPRQGYKYSKEFKLAAVRLSRVPGMHGKAVAMAPGTHPFMLSKWRKEIRCGVRARGSQLRATKLQGYPRTRVELKLVATSLERGASRRADSMPDADERGAVACEGGVLCPVHRQLDVRTGSLPLKIHNRREGAEGGLRRRPRRIDESPRWRSPVLVNEGEPTITERLDGHQ